MENKSKKQTKMRGQLSGKRFFNTEKQDLGRSRNRNRNLNNDVAGYEAGRGLVVDAAEGGVPHLREPQAGARHTDRTDCHRG
jgi:hypothetical protein